LLLLLHAMRDPAQPHAGDRGEHAEDQTDEKQWLLGGALPGDDAEQDDAQRGNQIAEPLEDRSDAHLMPRNENVTEEANRKGWLGSLLGTRVRRRRRAGADHGAGVERGTVLFG